MAKSMKARWNYRLRLLMMIIKRCGFCVSEKKQGDEYLMRFSLKIMG